MVEDDTFCSEAFNSCCAVGDKETISLTFNEDCEEDAVAAFATVFP